MTKRTNAVIVTILVAALAIAAPIWVAVRESRHQAISAEQARAMTYAEDVLHRSDTAADQVGAGIAMLRAIPDGPCSAKSIALMRGIDLSSSYIQGIGHIVGDRLMCSSFGSHGAGLPLGPVEIRTSRGVAIRGDVVFAFAPHASFIVLERDGFGAIIHKNLPIDVTTSEQHVALAIFTLEDRVPLSSRGAVSPAWLSRVSHGKRATFIDGPSVVAVIKSDRYLTAAAAAVPLAYVDAATQDVARRLVPVGVIAGLILTLAIVYLARLQLSLPMAIKNGLRRDEFFVLYQPIVDLHSGDCHGAEALLRWRRPGGEVVGPDHFIPIAEEAGLIERLTARVIELVAEDVGDVFRRHPHFHMAFNLSSADLHSSHTMPLLEAFLAKTGGGKDSVIVEATERRFLDVDAARQVTARMRAHGIRVAIDDFGTGYSNLSYLQSFDLDYLKIDRSFVETIGAHAATSSVVSHIIEMAKHLQLQLIAEGVETQAQADFLRERGVRYAQGWLFGRPGPFAAIRDRLS